MMHVQFEAHESSFYRTRFAILTLSGLSSGLAFTRTVRGQSAKRRPSNAFRRLGFQPPCVSKCNGKRGSAQLAMGVLFFCFCASRSCGGARAQFL